MIDSTPVTTGPGYSAPHDPLSAPQLDETDVPTIDVRMQCHRCERQHPQGVRTANGEENGVRSIVRPPGVTA